MLTNLHHLNAVANYIAQHESEMRSHVQQNRQFSPDISQHIEALWHQANRHEQQQFMKQLRDNIRALNKNNPLRQPLKSLGRQLEQIRGQHAATPPENHPPISNYEPSAEEQEHRYRFTHTLNIGAFTEHSYQHLCDTLRSIYPFIIHIHPFNQDQALIADIQRAIDCLEIAETTGQVEETFSSHVFMAPYIDTLKHLRVYFTQLQATMSYQPYHSIDLSTSHIKYKLAVTDFLLDDSHHAALSERKQILMNHYGISQIQIIRGDGNCYFRSILRTHIEQAILSQPDTRTQLFTHLADLIEHMVLRPHSIFHQLHENAQAIQALVTKLRAPTTWHSLQAFWHDISVADRFGDDYQLIRACRYVVAQYIVDHHDQMFNGLSLRETIEMEGVTLEQFIHQRVLRMNRESEGMFVDLGILPALIGSNANNIIMTNQPLRYAEPALNVPRRTIRLEDFQGEYGLHANFPYTNTTILLRPGHYDALITMHDQARMSTHLQQTAALERHLFNFVRLPSETYRSPSSSELILNMGYFSFDESIDYLQQHTEQLFDERYVDQHLNFIVTLVARESEYNFELAQTFIEYLGILAGEQHLYFYQAMIHDLLGMGLPFNVEVVPLISSYEANTAPFSSTEHESDRTSIHAPQSIPPLHNEEHEQIHEHQNVSPLHDAEHAQTEEPQSMPSLHDEDNAPQSSQETEQLLNDIQKTVLKMKQSLEALHDASHKLSPLLIELITHSNTFLNNGNLHAYKHACSQSLHIHKKEIGHEKGESRTLWQKLYHAIRWMFNVLDRLLSKLFGQKMMAETYTPAARFFSNGEHDHFLYPPKITPMGHALHQFATALDALKDDTSPSPVSRVFL